MVARITRQAVMALARGAGSVRSTQFAVSVLCNDTNPAVARVTRLAVNVLCADGEIFVDCSNSFGFVQVCTHNRVDRSCSNSLGWISAIGTDYEETITQYIGWTTRFVVDCSNSLFSESIGSGQSLNDVYPFAVSNALGWDQTTIQAHNATNSLSLSQTALPVRLEELSNSLGWVDSLDTSGTTYERDDTQQSLFRQRLTYVIQGTRCTEKEYSPFIGADATDEYGTINTVAPTLTPGPLTLSYPVNTPTDSIVLKNPEFGNTDSVAYSVVSEQTRGGDPIIYTDPAKWGDPVVTRTLSIKNLCDTLVQPLIDFINLTLGKEITLVDWEGVTWVGLILQPETTIQQQGRRAYNVTIQFQGRRT